MLRVATFNVNGIRASVRRGFTDWLKLRDLDVVALQEVRCPTDQLPDAFGEHQLSYHSGDLPGRNGVALLTREEPVAVRHGFGSREFDHEGRYLEVDLDLGPGRPGLRAASLYLPKGGVPFEDEVGLARFERKMRFCKSLANHLRRSRREALRQGREFVVMGDWNIAPTELDLKNWRTNRKSEGFLPEERAWIASQLTSRTLVDVVRRLHPDTPGPYSWWSWRGQSFANDTGWRIDYQLASPTLARTAVVGGTDRDPSYEERLSDHAPVVVDYEI